MAPKLLDDLQLLDAMSHEGIITNEVGQDAPVDAAFLRSTFSDTIHLETVPDAFDPYGDLCVHLFGKREGRKDA